MAIKMEMALLLRAGTYYATVLSVCLSIPFWQISPEWKPADSSNSVVIFSW